MDSVTKPRINQQIYSIFGGLKILSKLPKPLLTSGVLSSIFEAAVPFVSLYFSAQILNELVGSRSVDRIIFLVLMAIGLNLTAMLAQRGLLRWHEYCRENLWINLSKFYTDKMLEMDFGDGESIEMQEAYSQIRQHQNGMGFGLMRLTSPIPLIVRGVIQIALSVTLAFTLFTLPVPPDSPYGWLDSWWMITLVLLVLAGPVLLTPYLNLKGGKIWAKANEHNNKGNRFFAFYFFDLIQGSNRAKDIRIYDQGQIINRHNDEFANPEFQRGGLFQGFARYNGKYVALGTAIAFFCNGLLFLFVATKALAGAYEVGNIVLYVGALTQFGMGVASVLSQCGELLNNAPFLKEVLEFLHFPRTMSQGTRSIDIDLMKSGEIEFRQVSFKYPTSKAYVLRNVSLKFKVGQRLAIVGENGSGKTTLIKLLCRLYDPTKGEILLNGVNIQEYDVEQYREIFSIVFQDFKLLPLPLGQNVAVDVNYDPEKVEHVLMQAGYGERLQTMSNGLETYLYTDFEENGVDISGGEAQKIALARALYKDAPFVILDEPTAALDPIAEHEVYSKMNETIRDKTAVFISHRLSSCRFCHDIAVFHEGELVQRGSHEELVERLGEKYQELWNAQAQYYAEEGVSSALHLVGDLL